jgi:phosphoribosyl 1,2-cyclic phosphodiesterase
MNISYQDHCKGAEGLAKAGTDIYMSAGTAEAIGLTGHRIHPVEAGKKFTLPNWVIFPFATEHDAVDPLGFMIRYRPTGETIMYMTDTYYSRYKATGANYIICECNYVSDTLDANIEAGSIPRALRHRLLRSHFSLHNVIEWLKASDLRECRKIILVHLSDSNSDEARMVREITAATKIDTVAARAGLDIDLRLWPF